MTWDWRRHAAQEDNLDVGLHLTFPAPASAHIHPKSLLPVLRRGVSPHLPPHSPSHPARGNEPSGELDLGASGRGEGREANE